jgi:hypothetical protein
MLDGKAHITRSLLQLVGLTLSVARDAGSMKNFQFGNVGPHPFGKGTIGEFALHIQCSWRIVGGEGIVTGSADYYEPVEAGPKSTSTIQTPGTFSKSAWVLCFFAPAHWSTATPS